MLSMISLGRRPWLFCIRVRLWSFGLNLGTPSDSWSSGVELNRLMIVCFEFVGVAQLDFGRRYYSSRYAVFDCGRNEAIVVRHRCEAMVMRPQHRYSVGLLVLRLGFHARLTSHLPELVGTGSQEKNDRTSTGEDRHGPPRTPDFNVGAEGRAV